MCDGVRNCGDVGGDFYRGDVLVGLKWGFMVSVRAWVMGLGGIGICDYLRVIVGELLGMWWTELESVALFELDSLSPMSPLAKTLSKSNGSNTVCKQGNQHKFSA